MKASSNPAMTLARSSRLPLLVLLTAALVLGGCSSIRRDKTKGAGAKTPVTQTADKGDPQGRFAEAVEMMKNSQPKEAEEAFVALTKDFPQYAGPWTNLGILYAKSKRRDPAIAAFTRATQLNASNAVAYNWLGMLKREGGDYAGARLDYEKALQLTPDEPLARLNYAILLDQYLKQPREAVEQYKRYLQVAKKEDLRVLAWIAEIETRLKAAEEAQAAAQAANPAPAAAPAAAKPKEKTK